MSISSEITRLYNVRGDILSAITDKGVTVPSGSKLADVPDLIAAISGGGGFSLDNIVNIVPINKIVVVDANGYIGYDFTDIFVGQWTGYYYNYAILSESDDYSQSGLGRVTFYTPGSDNIGGRVYPTVTIGDQVWMAENLDFKFSGLYIATGTSNTLQRAVYYNNDEATYGIEGNKYGLLYNWPAVKYLNDNRSRLCPGWHVPTMEEYQTLQSRMGGQNNAGLKLKSTTGWRDGGNGDGSSGFEGVPAGNYDGSFGYLTQRCYLWTATESGGNSIDCNMYYNNNTFVVPTSSRYIAMSLRLIKDTH